MKRRTLLSTTLAAGLVATSKSSACEKPILLDYDQDELDKSYDQSF